MAILDRLLPRRANGMMARKVTGIKTWSETPGVLWGRPVSSAGVEVDEIEAMTISAVFAACFRLANIAAMLPVGIYRKEPGGRRTELDNHPAVRPLAIESNPEQTAFTARQFMQFWRPIFGSAVAEIGWDGAGRPRRLWPLFPSRVYPDYDDNEQLFFRVDGERNVSPRDIIYIPHVTEDGVCGKGFIHYALESLGVAIAADRSAGYFFKNDMRPGGLLVHEGNPPEQARKKFREEWALNQGGSNRGTTGVLWGGWKWVKDSGMIDPDKAQLLESRQWSVIEVARWLNVPPHWLAEMGRATWGNVENMNLEALIYTVQPILTSYEQEFDRKLLDPPRVYSKYNAGALLRTDSKTRGEFYRLMREVGVYSANDILALEDMNGIGPDGDIRLVPVNMQPLNDLMTGTEAQIKVAKAKANAVQVSKPSSPQGSSPPKNQEPSPSMRQSFKGVIEHALSGFSKKEVNEARRAVKQPTKIQTWADEFYPSFEELMASSLVPLALHASDLGFHDGLPAEVSRLWARSWVEKSQSELLTAQECRPEEWPRRAEELLLSWEGRAAMIASAISGGTEDAPRAS